MAIIDTEKIEVEDIKETSLKDMMDWFGRLEAAVKAKDVESAAKEICALMGTTFDFKDGSRAVAFQICGRTVVGVIPNESGDGGEAERIQESLIGAHTGLMPFNPDSKELWPLRAAIYDTLNSEDAGE